MAMRAHLGEVRKSQIVLRSRARQHRTCWNPVDARRYAVHLYDYYDKKGGQ